MVSVANMGTWSGQTQSDYVTFMAMVKSQLVDSALATPVVY